MNSILTVCAISALLFVRVGSASIVVSYESPSTQLSTVSGISQYTFDNIAPGQLYSNVTWAGVGTFDQYYVAAPNTYGGSNNTSYALTGAPSSILTSTLTFNNPEAYFGFDWLAVDRENSFTATFFSGATQVGTFSSATLLNQLGSCPGSAYCGNPNNRALDPGELFVYVDFTGTKGTTISQVTFSNTDRNTGFEYDSLAVSASSVVVPGTPVSTIATPEPSTFGYATAGFASLFLIARRRKTSSQAKL